MTNSVWRDSSARGPEHATDRGSEPDAIRHVTTSSVHADDALRAEVARLLERPGLDDGGHDPASDDAPSLARLLGAAVQSRRAFGPRAGAPVLQVGRDPDAPWVTSERPLHVHPDGFARQRARPGTSAVDTSYMTSIGFRIVGAGVSTCAPLEQPK